MRKHFVFILLSFFIIFSSCTKEAIIIPENETIRTVAERSTTIEIEVAEISNSEIGGEFLANFQASYDFTETVLEPVQYLKFVDVNGNTVSVTFQVNSFDGSNGALDVAFEIGTNNLFGLTLLNVQEIIIEDDEIQ